jgi:hypothetical protein
VFGRRSSKKAEEEAAREADRRALFEELAKRPDTVCPFLGLAEARTEYHDGVTDNHRCYAFGDPAELSGEQQQKVCLQRGYGNCPRYLRGVLVIPTEELEALRHPQPHVERPVAAAAVAKPARRRPARGLLAALGALVLLAAGGGAAAFWYIGSQVASSAAEGRLPAGTMIEAELVSLSVPEGNAQVLHATAAIGATEAAPNTTLIYLFDLSTTTLEGEGCGGDQNEDGRPDTPLDCEVAAASALNEQAVANGTVGQVGLVGFASGATAADLAPRTGAQVLIAPGADEDSDGTPNVVEAMRSAFSGDPGEPVGFRSYAMATTENRTTAFSVGIEAACDILLGTETENRLVVFLSDGLNLQGEEVSSVLPCDEPAAFQTFATGVQASCDQVPPLGGLQAIADLTEGTCTTVADLSQLPAILEAVVEPQLTRIELAVDDGRPIDISATASRTLPLTGPESIEINYSLPALASGDHRLCLTVFGSDAGGAGDVSSCSTVDGAGGRLTSSD